MPEAKTRWFDMLRLELDVIGDDELIEPDGEMRPDEKVVGIASGDIKKLHTRVSQLKAEALRAAADVEAARNERERMAAIVRVREIYEKYQLVLKVMWVCIRDEYRLWGGDSIGIRFGWKIVKKSDAGHIDILTQLRNLLD